jgi:transcriptional regulator with XRE-family HTH domain
MVNRTVISPNQLRAARSWLGWSRGKLTLKSGVSERAIARYERGLSVPHDETLIRLRATLEAEGIHFQFVGAVGTGIGIVVCPENKGESA